MTAVYFEKITSKNMAEEKAIGGNFKHIRKYVYL
jgi:hypothetical protein